MGIIERRINAVIRYNSVPKVAKLMGTTHTTVYDYIRRLGVRK